MRFLRYEDFLRHPERTVKDLLTFAGHAHAANPIEGRTVTLRPNHTVTGNPDRFRTGPTEVRAQDVDWRRELDVWNARAGDRDVPSSPRGVRLPWRSPRRREPDVNLGLRGKVALVAGGSSGLGFAVAEELAREGAEVCIAARDRTRLRVAEEKLRRLAEGRVHARAVDLRRGDEVDAWVAEVAEARGAPHIVVTNSAGPPAGPATGFSIADYRLAVETVMLPAIHLALATLPGMKERRWGRLLFITSETVCRPAARYALSGVARMGIVGFARRSSRSWETPASP